MDTARQAPLVVERVSITHPDAALLVEQVQQEYVVRYGGRDETPLEPAYFDAPRGAFFVGYADGQPVATGAWRLRPDVERLGSTLCAEIKRMYVVASHRRRGLAAVMLARLEDTARDTGADVMILETGTAQPEAMALYAAQGYELVESFGHYAWSPSNRCFAKRL